MDDFDVHPESATGPGVNLHDPAFSSGRLARMKRWLGPAAVAFGVGLAGGIGLLIAGFESGTPWLMAAGAGTLLGGAGFFAYVTLSISLGARREQQRQARAVQARLRGARSG